MKMGYGELETVVSNESTAKLANVISSYMIQNQMTLEHLDRSCEIVKEVYRKNATIRKAD